MMVVGWTSRQGLSDMLKSAMWMTTKCPTVGKTWPYILYKVKYKRIFMYLWAASVLREV